ncbi:ATP-binding cassette domain-containing protein [Secundilactobacillus odoratitofui]|uniref:ATP-binding cassette domain-containing protein n=1 Tax=Secundilactobacillus odoratitofui TaxID=480930 RepID=UPI00209347BB|nr:ATP-binding cassette domain-containing protein [Secundilactobacillus odoratitofui]
MALVETRHLNFEYALSDHKSLSDVTLSVEAGAFIVIAGPSGSGKTTLLRQLKPELQPVGKRTGEILFNGHPINELGTVVSAKALAWSFKAR